MNSRSRTVSTVFSTLGTILLGIVLGVLTRASGRPSRASS